MSNPCPTKPRGRPVGSKNKKTFLIEELVQAVLESFHELGGKKWLIELAKSDKKAYASILNKVIPSKVESTVITKEPEQIKIEFTETLPPE